MPVKCLTIVVYDENGSSWHFEKKFKPTWEDVVAPIDRLDQLRLFDPNKGSQAITVWTSDQGFADEEKYVTYDKELVLNIARYFGETGEPFPEAQWESL